VAAELAASQEGLSSTSDLFACWLNEELIEPLAKLRSVAMTWAYF
jgi:hypothetical protein